MRIFFQLSFLFLLGAMSSCTSYESLLNYSKSPLIPNDPMTITNFKPLTIQPNDMLRIGISSLDPTAVAPFKSSAASESGGGADEYLVNEDGNIEFPTIGKVLVKGLQIEEVKTAILKQLMPFFEQAPIVQVRLTNFRVNVNGEVGSPGLFSASSDRLTIIEAITLAGDFTIYSQRDSILIVREQDGVRNFGYINFNSADVFLSPYFYLQQNDVVYVRPNKNKIASVRDPATRFLPWISAAVSIILLGLAINRN